MDWLRLENNLRMQLENALRDLDSGNADLQTLATTIMTIDVVIGDATGRGYVLPEDYVDAVQQPPGA